MSAPIRGDNEPLRVCIDLDGVICELRTPGQTYRDVRPKAGAAAAIRRLRHAGHTIILHTARHMKTCGGNTGLVVARVGRDTLEWLNAHDIYYDEIHFGKPFADVYIDDNAVRFDSWDALDVDALPPARERTAGDASSAQREAAVGALTVVMPIAGTGMRFAGSRFMNARGHPPKPLIDVAGRPMIWWALRSFMQLPMARLVFIVREDHEREYEISNILRGVVEELVGLGELHPTRVEVVVQRQASQGQLMSALQARNAISEGTGVLIGGGDTLVRSDLGNDIAATRSNTDGLFSAIDLPGERWSFARVDADGRIVEVAEKRRISDNAGTGLYYFSDAHRFLQHAGAVADRWAGSAGELYVSAVYEEYLRSGANFRISRATRVQDFGTPGYLEDFLEELRHMA